MTAQQDLFAGLDRDLQIALRAQLRDLWTHTSTALEGNSLTLGDTAFILAEGLTVAGKPLKDHYEVVGHARAIEFIYDWVKRATPLWKLIYFNCIGRCKPRSILISTVR